MLKQEDLQSEMLISADAKRLAVNEQLNGQMPTQEIEVDAELDAGAANMDMVNKLSALEPFGQGNPEPTLVLRGGVLRYATTMGSGAHLSRYKIRGSSGGF